MKREDAPAAHSMDSSWFAVDAQGRVGLFDSGEDGAVPLEAGSLGGTSDANFDELVFHAAVLAKSRGTTWEPRPSPPSGEPSRLLVVKPLPGLDPAVFEEISAGPPWVGLSRKPLRFSKIAGDFTCVLTEEEVYEEASQYREDDEAPPAVYSFDRQHGDEPGAYGQVAAPAVPMSIDDLPASAQKAIGALRLPVDFSQMKSVHLADHLKDEQAAFYGSDWTLKGFGKDEAEIKHGVVPVRRPAVWPWVVLVILIMLAAWKALRSS